ncbi:MAG: hypothetical protein FJY65_01955 [Calditrichaeota bacterium]|nr:hypothetical protein [Calditrichota bacterium]
MVKRLYIGMFWTIGILGLFAFLDNPVWGQSKYICAACGKEITKQAVVIENDLYHPECFRCATCGEPIKDDYIKDKSDRFHHKICIEDSQRQICTHCRKPIAEPKFIGYQGKSYHNDCFVRYIAPLCDVCGEPLIDSAFSDFWGNRFHIRHSHEFPVCMVCGRLVTRDGVELERNRWVCSVCAQTSVTQPEKARMLLETVRDDMASFGIVVATLGLRIELVSAERLPGVKSAPGSDPFAAARWDNGKHAPGDERATIFILSGLPEDFFRGVIAHELMHIWQHENDADDLPQDLKEGSANWASSLIYSRIGTLRGRFFINSYEKSTDADYGAGYRKIAKYADSHGVQAVLEFLKSEAVRKKK